MTISTKDYHAQAREEVFGGLSGYITTSHIADSCITIKDRVIQKCKVCGCILWYSGNLSQFGEPFNPEDVIRVNPNLFTIAVVKKDDELPGDSCVNSLIMPVLGYKYFSVFK